MKQLWSSSSREKILAELTQSLNAARRLDLGDEYDVDFATLEHRLSGLASPRMSNEAFDESVDVIRRRIEWLMAPKQPAPRNRLGI